MSLAVAPQGVPLELSIAPSPALSQRHIEWKPDEPCIWVVAFSVKNISRSLHLRLRLLAESREVACTSQADDLGQGSIAPASAEALDSSPTESISQCEAGKLENGFDGEDLHPTLLPRCVPIFTPADAGEHHQQHKLIVPDYCYNDGVVERLGARVVTCNNFASTSALRPVVSGNDNAAEARSQRFSSGAMDGSQAATAEKDVSHTRDVSVEQRLRERGQHSQSTPHTQLQKLDSTASHATLARETHQQNSLDGCAPESLDAQPDTSIATSDGRCLWLGKVTHDVGVLPPGGSACAEFTALFPCPGVYNLNAMKIQVQIVADDATNEGIRRREFGGPTRRAALQRRYRGSANKSTAQLIKAGWPASDAAACVTFPFDFLVHVTSGDAA